MACVGKAVTDEQQIKQKVWHRPQQGLIGTVSISGSILSSLHHPCCARAVLCDCAMDVVPAGLQEDAPKEEVQKVRVEALRSLKKSIMAASVSGVVPGRRIILSERPPGGLSDNPSQQQLDADLLAVLKDNMGQIVEVMLPRYVCDVIFEILGRAKLGKAVCWGR